MFTWICPQCGREVPPAYDECPDCAEKAKQAQQASATSDASAAPGVPAAATAVPPPKAAPPAAPARPPQPPPVQAAPRRNGLNTTLLSIVFALAFVGLGVGVYWAVNYFRDRGQSVSAQPAAPLENPSAKGKAAAHPLQRYIEVTGVRFLQDAKKKTEVRFLVVNHSPDEIADLGGTVNIWGRTQKSEEEAVGSFAFKLPSIGPYQSKEMAATVDTKLRVYELPDWQNVTADLQLTSP
jgi:hypothetical protein